MRMEYDATNIKSNYNLLSDGWHPFKIVEVEDRESSKGYPQALAKCKCTDTKCAGASEVWNYVTVIPPDQKGASMVIHWLKSIGQPYEGKIVLDTEKWLGKKFLGKVTTEDYKGKTNNKLKEISPYRDMDSSMEAQPPASEIDKGDDDSAIPF